MDGDPEFLKAEHVSGIRTLSVNHSFPSTTFNLRGIEALTALQELQLSNSHISNFDPLAALPNLTTLDLGGTTLRQVTFSALSVSRTRLGKLLRNATSSTFGGRVRSVKPESPTSAARRPRKPPVP